MADNLVIIDFFGLPGSGKSNRAHLLAEKLRNNGKWVTEPSYNMDHLNSCLSRKIKKFVAVVKYSLFDIKQSKQIIQLILANGYNKPLSQYVNLAYKIMACKKALGKFDYIVFDEGINQSAVSLSVNSSIKANINFDCLKRIIECKIISIFVNATVEDALKRMEVRGEKLSRVEQEVCIEKKHELIGKYKIACEELCPMITVNALDVELDTNKIIQMLEAIR